MHEWKIIESLPNKIVTQQDLRRKGSWITPLILVQYGVNKPTILNCSQAYTAFLLTFDFRLAVLQDKKITTSIK